MHYIVPAGEYVPSWQSLGVSPRIITHDLPAGHLTINKLLIKDTKIFYFLTLCKFHDSADNFPIDKADFRQLWGEHFQPTGHLIFDILLAGAKYNPSLATATGEADVLAQILPAGHSTQVVCFIVSWYSPGRHGIYLNYGDGHLNPTAQSVHCPRPEKYCPASQFVRLILSADFFPGGICLQDVAPV